MSNRRNFIKKSVVGITAASLSPLVIDSVSAKASQTTETFKLGIAGYSFVHFKLDEALAMMKKVDVNYLCIKDFHLPFTSTDQQIKDFHATLKASNVTGYAVGPIYMRTNEEIDRGFEYAKRVGVKLIVGIPNHDALPYIEKKVKEYDFKYAIHIHGPEDKLYPDAEVVMKFIKNMDKRIGLCFDMGHNFRNGKDSVADLERYIDRIYDIHLKNVTEGTKDGKTCELGRGKINIPAFVKMLRKVKYSGVCSLEYEKDMKDPLAGIAESVGYYKGVLDATRF